MFSRGDVRRSKASVAVARALTLREDLDAPAVSASFLRRFSVSFGWGVVVAASGMSGSVGSNRVCACPSSSTLTSKLLWTSAFSVPIPSIEKSSSSSELESGATSEVDTDENVRALVMIEANGAEG